MKKNDHGRIPVRRGWRKIGLVMKLTTIIYFVCLMQVSATVYSQATKFTFSMKNEQVVDVLRKIEDNSKFRFFYQNEQVDVNRRVTIKVNDATVEQILDEIFAGEGIGYKVMHDFLILLSPSEMLQREMAEMKSAYSLQQRSISGKVTDSEGQPLPGVSIVIKGTTQGTVTNVDGNYSLTNVSSDAVLVFSFVGMRTQEVVVGSQTRINIQMEVETIGIEEVVAIGYGTVKKSDLTGSVASVDSERLLDKPAFNMAQAISGKVAGVKIVERSGQPGGNPMIRIRGTNSINSSNSPLVVVDGVVGVANALTILNPNEIASIEVLKDASATAIYGARGANGVILVTTKRGYAGDVVSYGVLQNNLESLNSEQFMYVYQQAWMNVSKYTRGGTPNWPLATDANILPADRVDTQNTYSEYPHLFEQVSSGGYSVPLVGRDGNYYKPRFDTDWEGAIFTPSTSTNHQVSIRGGSEKAQLGGFIGYSLEDGLLLNSNFERFSGRMTGDFEVAKWLDINTQLAFNKNKQQSNDVSYFSGGIGRGVVEAFPIIPLEFPDDEETYGEYAGRFGRNLHFPVGEIDHQSPWQVSKTVERFTDRSQFTGNLELIFKITSDLTFRTNFATDDNSYKFNYYGGIDVTRGDHGRADINASKSIYWQNENYFNYNKTVGDHNFDGLLGLSWSRYQWENLNTYNTQFFDDFYKWHNIGVGTHSRPAPSSSDGQNSLNSYFARLNYNYMSKYLFTFTSRVDGSSKFGANSKYGFFPSGSVAWRVTEEEFAQDIPSLSNLKLRFSVGQTGNQEIGSYVTQAFIGSTNVALGGDVHPGLYPSSMASPNLKWETTTQYNGGIDIGLINNRVAVSVDYYYKLTSDMLLSVPLPTSTTTGSVRDNYGEIENKGFEVMLNTHNMKRNQFNWFTDIAWSANRNKILTLGPTGEDILRNYWVGGANTVLREGESVATFWGLNRLGTYSTQEASLAARYGFQPGDVKYEDTNNDGSINASDGYLLGSAFPKWDMDFNNRLEYRNFDFSLDIRISYGAKIQKRMNHSGEDRQTMGNSLSTVLDAWRPDHQDTEIGQVRPGMGGAYYQTYPDTHWIQDASFVRGEGATLGYNFSRSSLDRIGVDRLRMYLTAKNFFVLTEYDGYDPEGNDSGNMDSITPHMDFYQYPRPTTFTFGVNVRF